MRGVRPLATRGVVGYVNARNVSLFRLGTRFRCNFPFGDAAVPPLFHARAN